MTPVSLLLPIAVPAIAGLLCLLLAGGRHKRLVEILFLLGATANLVVAGLLFPERLEIAYRWADWGMDMSLKLDALAAFILVGAAGLGFLIAIYSGRWMRERKFASFFASMFLFTIALSNGAALANNLVALLFFWEGLLLTLYAMIIVGQPEAHRTAVKAFFIVGVTDLCLMAGIGLAIHLAGTARMSDIHLTTAGLGGLAFVLMMIGAVSKAGAMPFHSWIPSAALDAPLPFMALVPAVLEKLLGIYLVARISLHLFTVTVGSWASLFLMILGAVTIILAVLMALVQKDYKKLLSFHAISQVGYMILGIGTAVPIGIVGGLFHMINHAMYKSTLFLTGGAVEAQTGTTDLRKLGGLASRMPWTFGMFVIAACSISGVPLTNGFYSKELVYDGALERGWIFYLAAVLGSFFTAASFLKLGHAAYKGKLAEEHKDVKEAPLSMLIPMGAIAAGCLIFGLGNALPLHSLVQPGIGAKILGGHDFAGAMPHNWLLVLGTVVALGLALANHLYGARRYGSGLAALDHIHHAPVMGSIYEVADAGKIDPYNLFLKLVRVVSWAAYALDRAVDYVYNQVATAIARLFSRTMVEAHNGSHAEYLTWSVLGALLVFIYLLGGI